MPTSLRIARRLVVYALAIYWLVIALGTHMPDPGVEIELINDKMMHFGAFTGLALLLSWTFMPRRPTVRRVLAVLAIALLYGMADEITQMWVPTRTADLHDWIADCCGAVAGLAVYFASRQVLSCVSPQVVASWPSTSPPAVP